MILLNIQIKKQRFSDWIKKQHKTVCALKDTSFKCKDIKRLQQDKKRYSIYSSTNTR